MLSASLNAVALAAYAYAFQYASLLREARRYYGSALQLVNAALSSRQDAAKDTTIISIMLFNTFTALTTKTMQAFEDCDKHIAGVVAVIKLRGSRQLETRLGLQLFVHMCSITIQSCLYHSLRVPADLTKLRDEAEAYLDANDTAWKLSKIIVRLAGFRADVRDGVLCDLFSIVNGAMKLDSELLSLGESMPAQWKFETVSMKEKSELVFEDYLHVYPDLWVGYIWNNLRTCRLLLHEEISNQLKESSALPPQSHLPMETISYQLSIEIMRRMISDICASIPQYSGHLPTILPSAPVSREGLSWRGSLNLLVTDDIPSTAGVYFLLWPLLNAGSMTGSDVQREWIIQRSRFLGRMSGIQQAITLGDILESGERYSA
jgi:hypothetical protein